MLGSDVSDVGSRRSPVARGSEPGPGRQIYWVWRIYITTTTITTAVATAVATIAVATIAVATAVVVTTAVAASTQGIGFWGLMYRMLGRAVLPWHGGPSLGQADKYIGLRSIG